MNAWRARGIHVARRLDSGLRAFGKLRAPEGFAQKLSARLGLGASYFPLDTPLGQVFVAFTSKGIVRVMRASSPAAFERAFAQDAGRPPWRTEGPPPALQRALVKYRRGGRTALRFDLGRLSGFEQAVLRKALEIPHGEVRPYAWLAREIGRPAAVRAVGSALAHNPIPLLIPCHRVVRSDGRIGNYGLGGPAAKRAALAAEGLDPDGMEALAGAGVRYFGSRTTHIYCFPTCRHARRIQPAHRVPLASARAARAAGFRPCRVCRPALAA